MKCEDILRRLFVSFFCPQACVICDGWTANAEASPLCARCRRKLEALRSPFCERCGIPLPGNLLECYALCSPCREGRFRFNRARAWGPYRGNLKRLIQAFKYEGYRRLVFPLGQLLTDCYRTSFSQTEYIIPVPIHPRRRAQRGFDQTLILGKFLARQTGVPLFLHLYRKRNTAPQFGFDLNQRCSNVRDAFELRKAEHLAGKRILLVDDVMTTGATLEEICRVLRTSSDVGCIDVLTIARAVMLQQI